MRMPVAVSLPRCRLSYWLAALAIFFLVAAAPLHAGMSGPGASDTRTRLAALGAAIGHDVALCDHDIERSSSGGTPARDHRPGHDECPICQFAGHAAALTSAGGFLPPAAPFALARLDAIARDDRAGRIDYLAANPRAPPRSA